MGFLLLVAIVGGLGYVAYKKGWLSKIQDKLDD
jgi:hypothetical protein